MEIDQIKYGSVLIHFFKYYLKMNTCRTGLGGGDVCIAASATTSDSSSDELLLKHDQGNNTDYQVEM